MITRVINIRAVFAFFKMIFIPANGNIFRVCARIFAVRQGRIDRSVLVAVRKVKPDAALRQKDRADAENVFVRGYINDCAHNRIGDCVLEARYKKHDVNGFCGNIVNVRVKNVMYIIIVW